MSDNRMTSGPIAGQMVAFAVPLLIGNLFQQLYNTVDALIVGRVLGEQALAAVTSTGSLVYLLISFFMGVSIGAGVVIARCYGAADARRTHLAVHSTLAVGAASSVLLTVFGCMFTPVFLRLMGTPKGPVMDMAAAYVRIYFAGSTGLVFYNICRGILQAVGDSRHPLFYLIISSCTNVVLDILFLTVFRFGVAGVALATILSQGLSVLLCMVRLCRVDAIYRVSLRQICFDPGTMGEILRNGIPSGLQNSVIGLANVVVQSNVNHFGELAMAGCGAYTKIEGFAFLPIMAFTSAITTFVSQNLGADQTERAKKGASFGLIAAIVLAELIGVISWLLAYPLIGAFIDNREALQFGVDRLRLISLFYCLLAASHALTAILRGAGKSIIPMGAMLLVWCVFRVTFLEILVPIYEDINVVSAVYPVTWAITTIGLGLYYLFGDWTGRKSTL